MKKNFVSKRLADFLVVVQISLLLFTNITSFAGTEVGSGTLLEEFDAIGSWKVVDNCSITADKSICINGNDSLKISSNVAVAGGECNIEGALPETKNLSALKNVEMNLYVGDLSTDDASS